jgi:superfamily II DNA or RNA helicase
MHRRLVEELPFARHIRKQLNPRQRRLYILAPMAGLLLKELKIRGLVMRTLIVAPANLCFQWQRELKEKFRESFEVVRSDVLRANYGQNPWQEKNQVITSISWVSRIDDAKESLLRSRWDLVIVDEAHKMAAYSADKKTLAYKLGEALSTITDHYLLMTATPHKGDPENFCLFLELLDRDIYGSVKSLEEAMRRHPDYAPPSWTLERRTRTTQWRREALRA